VYSTEIISAQDLTGRIFNAVEGLPPEMYVNALLELEYWMDNARATEGAKGEVYWVKNNLRVSLSCGESRAVVPCIDFHNNIFKMWPFSLGHLYFKS
jgi:hypothetical protein